MNTIRSISLNKQQAEIAKTATLPFEHKIESQL
jgi:hypothetical protein